MTQCETEWIEGFGLGWLSGIVSIFLTVVLARML